MRRLLPAVALILSAACSSDSGGGPTVPGGNSTGTIRGSVTDNTNAAVVGATVALTGNGQAARTTTTNTEGVYTFNAVQVGSYTIAITPPTGFTLSGAGTAAVTVASGQQANVNAIVLNRTTTGGGGGNAPSLVDISMVNTSFQPQQAEVAVGGTVRFTNNDAVNHNALGGGGIQTGDMAPGQVRERVMTTAGLFQYNCTLHPGMSGSIRVR
jgi:plastocyanin